MRLYDTRTYVLLQLYGRKKGGSKPQLFQCRIVKLLVMINNRRKQNAVGSAFTTNLILRLTTVSLFFTTEAAVQRQKQTINDKAHKALLPDRNAGSKSVCFGLLKCRLQVCSVAVQRVVRGRFQQHSALARAAGQTRGDVWGGAGERGSLQVAATHRSSNNRWIQKRGGEKRRFCVRIEHRTKNFLSRQTPK